jgi:hypothetical protein
LQSRRREDAGGMPQREARHQGGRAAGRGRGNQPGTCDEPSAMTARAGAAFDGPPASVLSWKFAANVAGPRRPWPRCASSEYSRYACVGASCQERRWLAEIGSELRGRDTRSSDGRGIRRRRSPHGSAVDVEPGAPHDARASRRRMILSRGPWQSF